ncbi:ribulokinase [Flammeovirgaceae bacterium SG7u.111]|nr:ribulokinase [Flammeovirgaceae bacterium SG7u.132]WPO35463.1 ribulokinase [Flammeovirgaceae bacterium SG7u.111]
MSSNNYVIGVDYGSDSVRSVVIDAVNGNEITAAVQYYSRWAEGKYCVPAQNQFRQHPLDYVEGLEKTITKALAEAGNEVRKNIRGITVDTTGSTPVAVDKTGTPLALTPGFEENPNAMFVLWKDHTSVKEAAEINELAHSWGGVDYTQYVGGVYSSEWFWAKLLHIIREDESVREAAYSWVEHCDWLPFLLVGGEDVTQMKRSRCSAGHKAMWHKEYEGLPSEEFLVKLDPLLAGLRDRLYKDTYTSDVPAGNLSTGWAEKLGLSTDVVVGVGAFDAHMGAVGGQIEPYYLSKVMGTSTCDILIAPTKETGDKLVKGICGQVDGSVVPNMMGLEAGQSAFGDVYAWFKRVLAFPVTEILGNTTLVDEKTKNALINEVLDGIIPNLSKAASEIPLEESSIIALDWMNGRRTPDTNQLLKGAVLGLNLGSDAPRIFRALVEATCFGAKLIVDRFINEGVRIEGLIGLGGVAKKSPFVMQTMADIMDMPIKIAKSDQTCALGAAMFAATVAGLYPTVGEASKAIGGGFDAEYTPNQANVEKYKELYAKYQAYGEVIENQIMKDSL